MLTKNKLNINTTTTSTATATSTKASTTPSSSRESRFFFQHGEKLKSAIFLIPSIFVAEKIDLLDFLFIEKKRRL